ncbi:MAG: hypothetical protein JJT96_10345 [Opitutales bacterium]|nr:hypothetical protein [Opitutales bacterium]
MKIGLKLHDTGYRFGTEERARIYLTNALEPKVKQLPQIGFDALAHEAASVNEIKWYKRFTVIIGNPPYSNFGQLNRNPFILGLLDEYKRGLDERKINLDDDFIKFVRFSEYSIAQTRIGILSFITNSSYLDGVTHRQMRAKLLSTFNYIEVLNLHGSTQRGEVNPLGGVDENVFDIMQGVAVGLFALSEGEQVARYADLWGSRKKKFGLLSGGWARSAVCERLLPHSQYYFLTPKTFTPRTEYEAAIPLTDMFISFQNGIKTDRDDLFFAETAPVLAERLKTFYSADGIRNPFKDEFRVENSSSYSLLERRSMTKFSAHAIKPCLYRPFDVRFLYYKIGLTSRPAYNVMRHMLGSQNIGLLTCRQQAELGFQHVFATRLISECCSVSLKTREITSLFPLYLVEDDSDAQQKLEECNRVNFSAPFLRKLAGVLGLKQRGANSHPTGLTPEDIFHYIYAVFHSPGYRSRYAEFLKIDFPRLPLTSNLALFRELSRLGGELVALHLLESPKLDKPITAFIGLATPIVNRVAWTEDTVWIDAPACRRGALQKPGSIGFKGIPEEVWNFHIGGYQVCHKWLKDRKGRTLTAEDIAHYHKIVIALSETIRLMAEIDEVIETHGGWPAAFQPATESTAR